jgi:hypothetical protein
MISVITRINITVLCNTSTNTDRPILQYLLFILELGGDSGRGSFETVAAKGLTAGVHISMAPGSPGD